jgi:hypothetical protein
MQIMIKEVLFFYESPHLLPTLNDNFGIYLG